MSKGKRKMDDQLKKRADLPFLHIFVLFRPSAYWMMPISIGEGDFLPQSTYSNAHLLWTHPHSRTQK